MNLNSLIGFSCEKPKCWFLNFGEWFARFSFKFLSISFVEEDSREVYACESYLFDLCARTAHRNLEKHKETPMPKSKRRIWITLALGCAFVFLSSSMLLSQGERGTLDGIVTDTSGAVVPNAEVVALHTGTNIETKTSTTDAGVYRMPYLPLGTYKITVKGNGFQSAVAENVTLPGAQTLTLDFKLSSRPDYRAGHGKFRSAFD